MSRVEHATPSSRVGVALIAVAFVVLAVAPYWGDRQMLRLLAEIYAFVALASLWNLLAGYAGLVSVGQQAFVGLGAYLLFGLAMLGGVHPLAAIPFGVLLFFGVPWVVMRARLFQMRMSSWRGLRFNFHGTYGGAFLAMIIWPILGVVTIGILMPLALWQQVAYLLGKLDAVNEGSGTLLDNTLIVWGRELGNTSHNMGRAPFIMAGKAGGALRTGRFLNFDKQEHAKLLVSVAQLMGMSSLNSVGNRVMNSGPLSGLVG